MKKQQAFQEGIFQTNIERQVTIQSEMLERQMSMDLGRSRQSFFYWGGLDLFLITAGLIGWHRYRTVLTMVPAVMCGFKLGYEYDIAFGTLVVRARKEAEHIRVNERCLLMLPNGMPTYALIERKRLALHRNDPKEDHVTNVESDEVEVEADRLTDEEKKEILEFMQKEGLQDQLLPSVPKSLPKFK